MDRPSSSSHGWSYQPTERQSEIASALNDADSDLSLGQWYLGALSALHQPDPDHLSQAAHSIREIIDKLPQVLGQVAYTSPAEKVKPPLQTLTDLRQSQYPEGWNELSISSELSACLSDLEDAAKRFQHTQRNARLQQAFLSHEGLSSHLPPSILQSRVRAFLRLGKFFQDVAHHNQKPSIETFSEYLEEFEDLIYFQLAPSTVEHLDAIDELIAVSPTEESQEKLRKIIGNNAAAFSHFLKSLECSEWLPFLQSLGVFSSLLQTRKNADGDTFWIQSPALPTLERLTSKAPEECLAILEAIAESENPRVGQWVIKCLCQIHSSDLIPRCLAVIKKHLNGASNSSLIFGKEYLSHLHEIGEPDAFLKFLKEYLHSLIEGQSPDPMERREWEVKEIDDNILDSFAREHPIALGEVIFEEFCHWASSKNNLESVGSALPSHIPEELTARDRPFSYAIEDVRSLRGGSDGLEHVFARRLYRIGKHLLQTDDEEAFSQFDHMLRSHSWKLFQRIRWQLYADLPEGTLEFAKSDVMSRLPYLGHRSLALEFEFASLLESHARFHASQFLSVDEVTEAFEAISTGPLKDDGSADMDYTNPLFFRSKQIGPFRSLLTESQLETYEEWKEDREDFSPKDYRPFSMGEFRTIHSVSPPEADQMEDMSGEELFHFLNSWEPRGRGQGGTDWDKEESSYSLAKDFAQFVDDHFERFDPSSAWWEKIERPIFLTTILESAAERANPPPTSDQEDKTTPSQPSNDEWESWFKIAEWLVVRRSESLNIPDEADTDSSVSDHNLTNVVRFLAAINHSKLEVPHLYRLQAGKLLAKIFSSVAALQQEQWRIHPHDYITEAINSLQGTSLEALLFSVHKLKMLDTDIETLRVLMAPIEESIRSGPIPTLVQAILGRHLSVFLYLCEELSIENVVENLIRIEADPISCKPLLVSHFQGCRPAENVITSFPLLGELGVALLKELRESSEEEENMIRDFSIGLGMHLGFYHWNGLAVDPDAHMAVVRSFFKYASSEARAETVRNYASSMAKLKADQWKKNEDSFQRTMDLWDDRLAYLERRLQSDPAATPEFRGELAALFSWMRCECLPFDWRSSRILRALELMDQAPHAFRLFAALDKESETPAQLEEVLSILNRYIAIASEDARWSIRKEHVRAILERGIDSESEETQQATIRIIDQLVRDGLSEYRDIRSADSR